MRPVFQHAWDVTPAEAIAMQRRLSGKVELTNRCGEIGTVCGLDVSYENNSEMFFAAAVVMTFPDFEVIEKATAACASPFPYVPGLLSFREIPVVAEALAKLHTAPDLFACDGQGYAHPRRFGLACHLGVLYDTPAIGLAKSRLTGQFTEPGQTCGDWSWLTDKEERIGQVVRTRDNVAPLFVSPGHRVSFDRARELALALCPQWRLPETTRETHQLVNEVRVKYHAGRTGAARV
jgi:deoxyribonuclease V